jgi:phosphate transport system substrate-binding protein
VDPIMQEWASAYKDDKGIQVVYQSKGSGGGIKDMTAQDAHFGCSDAFLTEDELEACQGKHGDVVHIPLCMGAVVIAYNLDDCPDLVFDGKTLIGIFDRKITKWNHKAIKALNPDAKLPDLDISVARRSDASGTTDIFTDYLTGVDKKAWTPGHGKEVKWHKETTGASKNPGVAALIKGTKGTIGYLEQIYALDNKIPFGKVKNSKGKIIAPDAKSVTIAAAASEIPDDLRYSIANAPDEKAYPIAGTVWAVCYVKQPAGRAKLLKDFLWWVTHDGQKLCDKLHYAPLPEKVVKKIEAKLDLIK